MTGVIYTLQPSPLQEAIDAIAEGVPEEWHCKIADNLLRNYAGQPLYIPKRAYYDKRNTEILELFFSGVPRTIICRQFHISRMTLHRIIVKAHITARILARERK